MLLRQAETAVQQSGCQALFDPFFWPRGSELKAWRLIHEAEEWLIPGFALL
ncbi:MAG: hypothetical protein NZ693_09145 [Thermoflexales bacterium]|nr:hypothetical protein [Thermoflexales bacterium]